MKKELIYRVFFYILGMLLLSFGISLNTRTDLGVSPLISVSFCVSELISANVGDVTLIWYVIFVLVEIICHVGMKRYKAIISDILQIPVCIVFTRFMNLFAGIIPDMAGDMPVRILSLFIAIILTGLGIVLTLNAKIVPNPGDGIVQALADCSGKTVSTMKNILDAVCVVITIVIGLVFAGKIIGIGIGTVLAVIFVGRVVAAGNYFFKEKMLKLSGLET